MTNAAGDLFEIKPFDALPPSMRAEIEARVTRRDLEAGAALFARGETLPGLFVLMRGRIELRDAEGVALSVLEAGACFGDRGLGSDGAASADAIAAEAAALYVLPKAAFYQLRGGVPDFDRFFSRAAPTASNVGALAAMPVRALGHLDPSTCAPSLSVRDAAIMMRDGRISCLPVVEDGALIGIVTSSDLTERALAEGLPPETPIARVMTPDPRCLQPSDLGADALMDMLERRIGHLPIVDGDKLVGILTRTDLIRFQAVSANTMRREITTAADVARIAAVTARLPRLLAQLVSASHRHETVTRMITDIADAATERLLKLAEARLGPPPVPFLWLACGSQGRREQTGVSDQDNCLILDDAFEPAHDAYFESFATFVSDGLAACGYYKCPGDMMATNPRWRQPMRVWRGYFEGWVQKPDPMAQMLASVMFDLRPIAGAFALFEDLQAQTLAMASKNSIFVAHMIANSLKHRPPLGLFGGLATESRGEGKGRIDMKHGGVAPIVDLGRVYALRGEIAPVGTRARLLAAQSRGVVSSSGGRDLIDAYDLIAEMRLEHQLARINAGEAPDNFLAPQSLSDLERHQLRDAFTVVRTMQSALGQGVGSLV